MTRRSAARARAACAACAATPLCLLLTACTTTVPRYDHHPPDVRLEVRRLADGRSAGADLVLRPGSAPVEWELGAPPAGGGGSGEGVDLSVTAVDGGGVRRVALVGRVTVGCWNPETGARTLDVTEVAHEDVAREGPGGAVRSTASVGRTIRVSDYAVRCADAGADPWVEGTFHGEAEDFHGRWTATGPFTFWFGVEGGV